MLASLNEYIYVIENFDGILLDIILISPTFNLILASLKVCGGKLGGNHKIILISSTVDIIIASTTEYICDGKC